MGVSSSLYASISGLSTMGNAMSVLGDNVSNVNTIAFKSSRATFQDVLSQSVATAAGAAQVGRGVTMTTIDGIFAQGSFESTSTATDLAIGGQGFFMLRASGSAEADMYTRAGEFRFDKEGYLVNPTGNFVQGWTLDTTSGERQGTIGDINLGKTTPPVATTGIQVIANVDSRKNNEATEQRLFDAWNGTNPSLPVPTSPIDAAAYEYTTAIKVYDSVGASHDLTVYFDRTTEDNQWEFLVTCEPSEDNRVLTTGRDTTGALDGTNDEVSIYTPETTYNYTNPFIRGLAPCSTGCWISPPPAPSVICGPGTCRPTARWNRPRTPICLLWGIRTSTIPLPRISPAQPPTSRLSSIFGARYSGQSTEISQILVSDGEAYSTPGTSTPITKETLWNSVYDSTGTLVDPTATVSFTGYDNGGTAVLGSYTLAATDKVQDLLDALDSTFNCTSTIDAAGKIKMTDATGGPSGMALTSFTFSSGVNPFGGTALVGTHAVISGDATHYFASDGAGTAATSPTALLNTLFDPAATAIANADGYRFSGTAVDGTAIVAGAGTTFTVGAGSTVQNLLDFLSDLYADGAVAGPLASPNVSATLGADGRIRIVDNTGGTSLAVTINSTIDGGLAPLALPLGVNATAFTALTSSGSQINVTTSKQQVISTARSTTTFPGSTPITGTTALASVFDAGGTPLDPADTLTFTGIRSDGLGGVFSATFAAGIDFGSPLTAANNPPTMQDLLSWLEAQFNAEASVDGAGRLVLTDRRADEVAATGYHSQLASHRYYSRKYFRSNAFRCSEHSTTIAADTSGEDGSRVGETVSINFSTEALSTTQYANSSTTIFQDQNGFAAGFLQSVSVDTAGIITGNYSNGQVLERAQVALASFNNLAGLSKEGGNIFRETSESGAPITGPPATNGLGTISPNSLEQSNVDLGAEFVKLITTQRGFQANSKIITTTDEMLADLINIKR